MSRDQLASSSYKPLCPDALLGNGCQSARCERAHCLWELEPTSDVRTSVSIVVAVVVVLVCANRLLPLLRLIDGCGRPSAALTTCVVARVSERTVPSCTLGRFSLAELCQRIRTLLWRWIGTRGTQVEQRAKQSCATLLRNTTISRELSYSL